MYDRFGQIYDSSKVITGQVFDETKYKAYSPPYLPATFAFVYGLSFASITSVLSHVYFFHWEEIVHAFRGSTKLDIHARLMRSYKKVPFWWWISIIVAMLAIAIAMTEVFHTGLPVYGIFLAFIIPTIYMIPCGMIQGVTNGECTAHAIKTRLVHPKDLRMLIYFSWCSGCKPNQRLVRIHRRIHVPRQTSCKHDFQDSVDRRCWTGTLFRPRQ